MRSDGYRIRPVISIPRPVRSLCVRRLRYALYQQGMAGSFGFEMPTTVDEWYEGGRPLREQDANGNGDPNDEIPLTGSAKTNLSDLIRYINPRVSRTVCRRTTWFLDQETLKPVFIPADAAIRKQLLSSISYTQKALWIRVHHAGWFHVRRKNEERRCTLVGTGITKPPLLLSLIQRICSDASAGRS